MDAWIRWTHEVNGWKWAVMDGANVLADGCEPSENDAKRSAIAAAFVAKMRAELTPEQFAEMQNLAR